VSYEHRHARNRYKEQEHYRPRVRDTAADEACDKKHYCNKAEDQHKTHYLDMLLKHILFPPFSHTIIQMGLYYNSHREKSQAQLQQFFSQ
jgi:hypothetical protein